MNVEDFGSLEELKGRTFPDPILTKVCSEVSLEGNLDWLEKLALRMIYTMIRSKGVGLAAPQVGEAIRLFVVDVDWVVDLNQANPIVCVNPSWTPIGDEKVEGIEGCLSFPGEERTISRYMSVHLKAHDAQGAPYEMDAHGVLARVIQHESDHLEGKTFGSGLSWLKRKELAKKLTKASHIW